MEKKRHLIIAIFFYIAGTAAAIYVGAFLMIIKPIYLLYTGFVSHTLTAGFVIRMCVRLFLSATVFGFIWSVGYVLFNRFMGTEDPDWSKLNPKTLMDEADEIDDIITAESEPSTEVIS